MNPDRAANENGRMCHTPVRFAAAHAGCIFMDNILTFYPDYVNRN